MLNSIPEETQRFFDTDNKVGLIAIEDDEGYPHITMVSTLGARNDKELMFGQFCEGLSKRFIQKRPKTGFLVLSMDKELWRGRAVWKGKTTTGTEFEKYNDKPLFRYNSYFGINTVHFMDLIDISEKSNLDMGAIIRGALATRIKRGGAGGHANGALNKLSHDMISGLSTLKFIATKDDEGYCTLTPIIQAAPSGNGRIVFTLNPYKEEIARMKPGQKAAIFAMQMDTVSVLTKGIFTGIQKGLGVFDIEKVYNPLMPFPCYVYPREELKAVTEFI
jgi:hypothetical protein